MGGEIIVSARRRSERLIDVPVAALAIGSVEIRQYDITNLQNIKFAAPQISFDRGGTGSGASISMRGVSSSNLDAGLEQSVLVDYDGMPISRGRVVSDAMFDVEMIDILKGPQALFFGKNSPGGVVSIKSANPTDTLSGYARAGYEFTKDEASFEAAISGPLGENFGARLAVFASDSKGHLRNMNKTGVTDPFRTARLPTDTGGTFDPPAASRLGAEEKLAGRLTLRYDDGTFDGTFKLLVSHFASDGIQSLAEVMACPAGQTRPVSVNIPDPTGDCKLNNRVSYGVPPQAVLDSWTEVARYKNGQTYTRNNLILPSLTLNNRFGDITVTSITSLMDYNFVNQGNADKTSFSYFFSNNNEKNQSFVQEFRAVSSFDSMVNFTTGGYISRDKRTFFNGTVNIAPEDPTTGKFNTFDMRADNRSNAWSVMGQLLIKPTEQLEIAGGARYTKEKKKISIYNTFVNAAVATSFYPVGQKISGTKTEDNISPEATVTYHVTPDVMTYVAYKTGYLSGGFSNPGNLTPRASLATITYDAAKARGFESGTKFSLADRTLTGSLIGYRYVYKGLQLTSTDLSANPPIVRTQNAGDSVSQGVELELNYRPVSGLTLRGSLNYNDAHFRTFVGAQCYTRQTADQGCIGGNQDLSGKDIYRAPAWIGTAGVFYNFELDNGVGLTVNADMRYSSSYFTSLNLNPLSHQDGYALVNAGVRMTLPDDRWSFAVIGRNLTNARYATLGNDKTSGNGEVTTTGGEPRAVVLQVETRF